MKRKKKLLCGILSAMLSMNYAGAANPVIVSDVTPVIVAKDFTDVTYKHWAYSYIWRLSGIKGIDGMSDGTFRPEAKVTREQFMKMLVSCLCFDTGDSAFAASQLTDVSSDRWSAPYISTALHGIYDAKQNNGKFRPAENMTRGVAAEWIVNGLRMTEIASSQLRIPSGSKFTDVPGSSALSEKINIAAGNKLINGYSDNTFRPNNTLTRAEAAAMLMRMYDFAILADGKRSYSSSIGSDMLPQLDGQQREAIFTKFVCPLTAHMSPKGSDYSGGLMDPDNDAASSAFWISLEYQLPVENFGGVNQIINGNYYWVFMEDEFKRLAQLLYGKSYDLSKYKCSSPSVLSEDNAQMGFLLNGKFYLKRLPTDSTGIPGYVPLHLFYLGGNRYFAMYEYWFYEMGDSDGELGGTYGAVIEKLSDGNLNIIERYTAGGLPTEAELSLFRVSD